MLYICTLENNSLTQMIGLKDSVIDHQSHIIGNLEAEAMIRKTQIHGLQTDLKLSRSETERQKTLKIAYLLGGGIVSGVLGLFLLR